LERVRMAETKYVETEALLAALNEDDPELWRLLSEMLPGERARLAKACETVVFALYRLQGRTLPPFPQDGEP
jgi:hypothetical protein